MLRKDEKRRGWDVARWPGPRAWPPLSCFLAAHCSSALLSCGRSFCIGPPRKLLDLLGSLSGHLIEESNLPQVATSVDLDDFPIPTKERSARTAVIAYTATFFSGMPFQVGKRGGGEAAAAGAACRCSVPTGGCAVSKVLLLPGLGGSSGHALTWLVSRLRPLTCVSKCAAPPRCMCGPPPCWLA